MGNRRWVNEMSAGNKMGSRENFFSREEATGPGTSTEVVMEGRE